jgi:molybdate transport system ATP-binding protein
VIAFQIHLPLASFSLDLDCVLKSSITALMGSSGSGKTCLLETLVGIRKPLSGKIQIGTSVFFSSESRQWVLPEKRNLGYLPQDLLLFPHKNVLENIVYGTRNKTTLCLNLVVEILEIGALLDRFPSQISGGEKQRVALARALMTSPQCLLLDEPMTALDRDLKNRLFPYLRRVFERFRVPVIFVTHDWNEVCHLAEEVLVLDQGSVIAQGTPHECLKR